MRTLVLSCVLGASLAAQRRFTIDASNGPGTDFTDTPEALAQAQHGDVYRVRPGVYSPVVTNLGVTLLGEPGAILRSAINGAGTVVVFAVPPGRAFVLRGFEVRHGDPYIRGMAINDVAQVHLEDVIFTYTGNADPGASVAAGACSVLTLTRCRCDVGVTLTYTRAWFTDCDLRGRDSTRSPLPAIFSFLGSAGVTIAGGNYRGGSGGPGQSRAAVSLSNGTFFITGDASTHLYGGSGGAPAIFAGEATLNLDPRVVLVPSGAAPPIQQSGVVRVVSRPLAFLTTSAAPIGGTLTGTLSAAAGDMFLLAASLVGEPLWLFDMPFLIDPATHVGLGFGTLTSPTLTFSVAIPVDLELQGARLAFQAAVLPSGSQQPGLTNPAIAIVH
jgi:hypothetical protein